jgi:hypothetical protein
MQMIYRINHADGIQRTVHRQRIDLEKENKKEVERRKGVPSAASVKFDITVGYGGWSEGRASRAHLL